MFGFLKDKLKQTVQKLTKEVDKATEEVVPTDEQKKEIIEEIKKEQKEEKGFFARLKEKFTQKEETEREKQEEIKEVIVEEKKRVLKDEGYGIEVVKEAHKPEEIKKKIEEGEKEIEALAAKKEKEEQEHERKKKAEQKEEKGFFTRLKEKFTHKEETEEEREKESEEKEELFKTTSDELKEFEEAFKEAESPEQKKENEEEKEEIIPVITETEDGETVVELHKKYGKEEIRKSHATKEEKKQEKKIEERNIEETKIEEEPSEETEEGQGGFFSALKDTIFKTSLSEEKFEELFWDLELILLENNVAVEVIDLIKANLKKELVEKKILRGQIEELIIKTLRKSVEQTFDVEAIDVIERIKEKKPYIIVFVGINGSGKTTTIAKMIQKLKDNNLSCVVAAGDTFRAAAIQQLEEHTTRLNVKLIKHDYGSDPAAVGFDAIKYAQAHNIDCVLIDTAGRLHSNVNLMDEMKKIIRVTKPDFKIFIGEAITGNDCVDQARKFNEAVGIDGIILAKADVDEKGGAALSISYVTRKPILYLGIGQNYNDLEEFDKEKIMEQLGLA